MLSSRIEGLTEADTAIRLINLEIKRCEEAVSRLREIEAKNLIYMSRAKWAEEGGKKYKIFP